MRMFNIVTAHIYLPIDSLYLVYLLNSGNWITLPPKGSYLASLQMRSVTSSILGPWHVGLLFRATESHSPNWSGYGIHVGDACHLILHNATCTHGHHLRGWHDSYHQQDWGYFVASSGGGSLLRHAVTPRKLGVSVTHQMTSNSCVGEGASCGVVVVFNNSVQGIQTTFSSQLQNLSLGPLNG